MKKIHYFNITWRCNNKCLFCAADLPGNPVNDDMPFENFLNFLDKHDVSEDCRIILNGGEPTLHPRFLDFVAAASERNALVDIFSNGIRFSDPSFCHKVLSYPRLHIRIPLFGATASTHDFLTGRKGTFECVLNGFSNLIKMKNQKTIIEIKFLLSKITVDYNLDILRMFIKKFPEGDYIFSLNSLLVSQSVLAHRDLFLERYTDLIKKSIPLLQFADAKNIPLSLAGLPLCLLPSWSLGRMGISERISRKTETYSDPNISFSVTQKALPPPCRICSLSDRCQKFPENYLAEYGWEEAIPKTILSS